VRGCLVDLEGLTIRCGIFWRSASSPSAAVMRITSSSQTCD
jgi:hypothetical protein